MYIGGPSEQAQVYVPVSGKGGGAELAPNASGGDASGAAAGTEAATFFSPVVAFNYQAGIAVLEFLDSTTGEVTDQVPSRKAVQEYMRHGAASQDGVSAAPPAPDPAAAPPPTGDGPAAPPTPVTASAPPAPPVQAPAPAATAATAAVHAA